MTVYNYLFYITAWYTFGSLHKLSSYLAVEVDWVKITHQNLEIVFAIKAILQGPKNHLYFMCSRLGINKMCSLDPHN